MSVSQSVTFSSTCIYSSKDTRLPQYIVIYCSKRVKKSLKTNHIVSVNL